MHRNGFFRRDESTPKPGDFLHAQRKWRRFRETSLLRSQGDSSHAQRKWRRWKHLAEILPMNASHGVCICTLPVVEKTSFEIPSRVYELCYSYLECYQAYGRCNPRHLSHLPRQRPKAIISARQQRRPALAADGQRAVQDGFTVPSITIRGPFVRFF